MRKASSPSPPCRKIFPVSWQTARPAAIRGGGQLNGTHESGTLYTCGAASLVEAAAESLEKMEGRRAVAEEVMFERMEGFGAPLFVSTDVME